MCKSVSLFAHVSLFLFAALVMLLFKVLLCVLKVKTLPQGFFAHRRDWEQWWHLHCDLFGVFWSWWSKDGLDPADLYLHFHSAICQHQRPLTNTPFHPPCAPSHHHLPHPSPSRFFYTSSVSVCSSLQNVMRQASRRKHGSGVLRGIVAIGKICPN